MTEQMSASPTRGECCVLVNQEEQYSLWPAAKAVPAGWTRVFAGDCDACLAHVEAVWTDMRPKGLRDQLAP